MVKFLIAHALELEDKAEDVWPDSSTCLTYGDMHLERSRVTHAMIMDIQNYNADEDMMEYPEI